MAEVIMKSRTKSWDKLKLFRTIEDLSYTYFAGLSFTETVASISFYSIPHMEFVCKWKFDKNYFDEDLKNLFHKHNSSLKEERKEQ